MIKLAEFAEKTNIIKEKAEALLQKNGRELKLSDDANRPIRLVFAGQYSAGKSSIIKMLTGDDSVGIGAGITTQEAHSYEWNGLEIIDTPGIHTKLRPDHDEISYEAIMSADMLVFVITNELFDDYLARHFRNLAIDKDKAGELLLVVNKMERTSLGNTSEQQEIIKEDLRKVLEPYTPEQLGISFLDAESYLDSLNEDDEEFANELKLRSGYSEFIDSLNAFVKRNSLNSRLTTTLYEIDAQLDSCIKDAQPKSEDSDIDALEENYMQQRHELFDSRNRLQQEIHDLYVQSATKLRTLGMDASALITESCKQEDVEKSLAGYIEEANSIVDSCQNDALSTLESRLNEIDIAIENIENSAFTQNLIGRLEKKMDKLPQNIQAMLHQSGDMAQKAGNVLVKNAYKGGVNGGLKLANFSGGNVHNIVLKAGHAVGYKFKPWEAVKFAKGVAVAGHVLGILGVGLQVFMQIKEDHDEDKLRASIRENKQSVRSQFYSAANELEDHGRLFIEENILAPLDSSIEGLDSNLLEIRSTKADRNEYCLALEELQRECQQLIKSIHSAA